MEPLLEDAMSRRRDEAGRSGGSRARRLALAALLLLPACASGALPAGNDDGAAAAGDDASMPAPDLTRPPAPDMASPCGPCAPPAPLCDPDSRRCVACLTDGDCGAAKICENQ